MGCASQESPRPPPTNHCETTADCGSGVCDPIQRVCVATDARTELVFFALPPEHRFGSEAAATVLEPRTVSSDAPIVDIALSRPRTVVGVVGETRVDPQTQHASTVPVAARVRFRRQGATRLESPVEVHAGAEQQTMDVAGRTYPFTYSVRLVPGDYEVTVTPSSDADAARFPPFYDHVQVRIDESGAPLVVNYNLAESLTRVAGVVHNGDGAPVAGLTVRAVDPEHSHVPVSTAVVTGADGAFEIALAPGRPGLQPGETDSWALQVTTQLNRARTVTSARYQTGSSVASRMVYQISRAALGAGTTFTGLVVQLPSTRGFSPAQGTGPAPELCEECVVVQQRVEGTRRDGTTVPLAGAALELRSDTLYGPLPEGHRAWFEAQVVTGSSGDLAGEFEAALPPGRFNATVTPSDEHFAITETTLLVNDRVSEQRGAVLEVRPRLEVSGSVLERARGAPMGNVQIEAVPLVAQPHALCPVADRPGRSSQNRTDGAGAYRLSLDPGQYLLVARPTPASGFATTIRPGLLCVTEASDAATEPIYLESPLGVQGRVRTADERPVAEAVVRAFARVRSGIAPVDIELAQSATDAAGGFRLLVPSRLVELRP